MKEFSIDPHDVLPFLEYSIEFFSSGNVEMGYITKFGQFGRMQDEDIKYGVNILAESLVDMWVNEPFHQVKESMIMFRNSLLISEKFYHLRNKCLKATQE